jgi:hypothetical protein
MTSQPSAITAIDSRPRSSVTRLAYHGFCLSLRDVDSGDRREQTVPLYTKKGRRIGPRMRHRWFGTGRL